MRKSIQKKIPINIDLPERLFLADGSMVVTLKTLDELEQFWDEYKFHFKFACEGVENLGEPPIFIHPYQWVFSQSKSSLIKTVFRWGEIDISCEFRDGAWRFSPELYDPFYLGSEAEDLSDPSIPIDEAVNHLCEQTFDSWIDDDGFEAETHDQANIIHIINYWKKERDTGQDYYGSENEAETEQQTN